MGVIYEYTNLSDLKKKWLNKIIKKIFEFTSYIYIRWKYILNKIKTNTIGMWCYDLLDYLVGTYSILTITISIGTYISVMFRHKNTIQYYSNTLVFKFKMLK